MPLSSACRVISDTVPGVSPPELVHGGLPAVCWTLRGGGHHFSLYDLSDRLRARGWQVPAYSMPPKRQDLVVQRILIRHGVSRDLGDILLEDYQAFTGPARKASGYTPTDRK